MAREMPPTPHQPHRMLVVHNIVGTSDRLHAIDPKPFRKFALGSLLATADDVAERVFKQRVLQTHSLVLPGDVAVYGKDQLQGIAAGEKYDSVLCHLVLDHGGVVAEDFLSRLRAEFLEPDGHLLNPVKSIAKSEVARASSFELATQTAPCVIKKDDNYNDTETVFEIHTQAELDAWRAARTTEEQSRFVVHKLLRYYGFEETRMYQLERWYVLFDDLTVNYRYADEFFVKIGTSLSYWVRDERRMKDDVERLARSGLAWKGRAIDCAYDRDPAAWDARYAVAKRFRQAFGLDYAELDVIRPTQGDFVVIDVNNTPGAYCRNAYWRELAVRILFDNLPGAAIPVPALRATGDVPGRRAGSSRAPSPAPARDRPRTNICLSMIVKNEVAVLPRLFRSIKDYIDYYVIVDTGSTDGTIELIQREMRDYGIDGEVHEREWVNFGVNRQQALELAVAAGKADWIFFIDADEELGVSDPKFHERFEPGVSYNIEKHQGPLRYAVPAFVNIKASRFRWEGAVHNYLVTVEGPEPRELRKDVWIVYHYGQGAKSHGLTDQQKYLRDAKVLEEQLAKNPNDARSQFYLGQSYRDAGQLEQALAAYKTRAAMEHGFDEERFVAQLEAGRLSVRLDAPEGVVLGELLAAYNLRPTRAEPLYELARYYRMRNRYAMAALFAKAGVETPCPDDLLFITHSIYSWQLLDELAVASYWIGDSATGKKACETLLERVERGLVIPAGELERIRYNLAEANAKLGVV